MGTTLQHCWVTFYWPHPQAHGFSRKPGNNHGGLGSHKTQQVTLKRI